MPPTIATEERKFSERLKKRVQQQLELNRTVIDADRVRIDVEGDVVVLRGEVGTGLERRRMEQLVLDIDGVGAVRNQLVVNEERIKVVR